MDAAKLPGYLGSRSVPDTLVAIVSMLPAQIVAGIQVMRTANASILSMYMQPHSWWLPAMKLLNGW